MAWYFIFIFIFSCYSSVSTSTDRIRISNAAQSYLYSTYFSTDNCYRNFGIYCRGPKDEFFIAKVLLDAGIQVQYPYPTIEDWRSPSRTIPCFSSALEGSFYTYEIGDVIVVNNSLGVVGQYKTYYHIQRGISIMRSRIPQFSVFIQRQYNASTC